MRWMFGRWSLFFRGVEERQGPQELRCHDVAGPEVQWSEFGGISGALEYVLNRVLLLSTARAGVGHGEPNAQPIVLK